MKKAVMNDNKNQNKRTTNQIQHETHQQNQQQNYQQQSSQKQTQQKQKQKQQQQSQQQRQHSEYIEIIGEPHQKTSLITSKRFSEKKQTGSSSMLAQMMSQME